MKNNAEIDTVFFISAQIKSEKLQKNYKKSKNLCWFAGKILKKVLKI